MTTTSERKAPERADLVTLTIDGREIGRWRWRQNYLYENPGTTELDAENALADARAIGIRANISSSGGGTGILFS